MTPLEALSAKNRWYPQLGTLSTIFSSGVYAFAGGTNGTDILETPGNACGQNGTAKGAHSTHSTNDRSLSGCHKAKRDAMKHPQSCPMMT